MAGMLTHFWVFHEAIKKFGWTGRIGRIRNSEQVLWDQQKRDIRRPYYYKNYYPKNCCLASYGYLGAAGPDLFLVPDDAADAGGTGVIDGELLSSLMHYNKTGGFMIWYVDKLRRKMARTKSTAEFEKLSYHYAYALGHISHIATDVVIHPLVNTMAASYYRNEAKQFENSLGSNQINAWKLHHKVEHYQDAYVRANFFEGKEGRPHEWRMLDFPQTAAWHVAGAWGYGKKRAFQVNAIETFYQFMDDSLYGITASQEIGKMGFFTDVSPLSNVSFRNYYINCIPDAAMMRADQDKIVMPRTFDWHVKRAVDLAVAMMKEADTYDPAAFKGKNATAQDERDLYAQKRDQFPLLHRNWNLDGGIGYEFHPSWQTHTFRTARARLHLPLLMHMAVDHL